MGSKLGTLLIMLLAIDIGLGFMSDIPTGTHLILSAYDVMQNPQGITMTQIFTNSTVSVLQSASAGAGGALAIGLLLTGQIQLAIYSLFATSFVVFIGDFAALVTHFNTEYAGNPIGTVISIVFGLLVVLYIFSVVEWWRGTD